MPAATKPRRLTKRDRPDPGAAWTTQPGVTPAPSDYGSALACVLAIKRNGPDAPAAIAFRSALRRIGAQIHAVGGTAGIEAVRQRVADADLNRAQARAAIFDAAWGGLAEPCRETS